MTENLIYYTFEEPATRPFGGSHHHHTQICTCCISKGLENTLGEKGGHSHICICEHGFLALENKTH